MFATRYCRSACLALFLLLPGASSAVETSGTPDEDAISSAVRLLEAEVSESVILKWFESQSTFSGSLSPADLIRLSNAGASDSLLEYLLDRSTDASEQAPVPNANPPEEVIEEETSAIHENLDAPPPPAASPSADNLVEARWVLRNTGPNGFDPDEGDRRRDLVVYLDGLFFERLTTISSNSKSVERITSLNPGPHEIRVTRDLHELTSKKKDSWVHEVHVFPEDFRFELSPGKPCEIEIAYNESSFSRGGPVTIRVTREATILAESTGAGPGVDQWPRLCEAVDANYDTDKQDSFGARSRRKGCLPWQAMWTEEVETDWQAALAAIRESGPTH